MKFDELKLAVESILFASDEPLNAKDLQKVIDEVDVELKDIRNCISELNDYYIASNRSFQLMEQGGGWQFTTIQKVAPWMNKLFAKKQSQRLSQRALETLSIVAYNQPITKGTIEEIRGVNSDGIVRSLLEKDLVTVVGRQKSPGNPMLYSTTKRFLRHFGINSTSDLPSLKEIDELLQGDSDLEKEIKQLEPEELGIQLDRIKEMSVNISSERMSEEKDEQ